MRQIGIKRIYDETAPDDGFRVLVDRIWPRGISKEAVAVDRWAKDIAPSTELRKWFDHDPEKWTNFQKRYRNELKGHTASLHNLIDQCGERKMTLLFAAKDRDHNHAVVLKGVLDAL